MIAESPGIRLLRRRVIIREIDFGKLKQQALHPTHELQPLYDTAVFVPINAKELANTYLLNLLKGPKPGPEQYHDELKRYLSVQEHSLYNPSYLKYSIYSTESGQVYVQSRKDFKPSQLGWGILERRIKSSENETK